MDDVAKMREATDTVAGLSDLETRCSAGELNIMQWILTCRM